VTTYSAFKGDCSTRRLNAPAELPVLGSGLAVSSGDLLGAEEWTSDDFGAF